MNSSTLFTHEEIAARARELWRARGEPEGRDDEMWFEAERQLVGEQQNNPPRFAGSNGAPPLEVDDNALAGRLDDFGDPGSRSSTAMDPTD